MDNAIEKKTAPKGLLIPFLITLLSALLLVSTIFMPYASATDTFAERIDKMPDTIVDTKLNMTAEDMRHISMFEYAQAYININDVYAVGIVYVVFVAMIGAFALLTLLFALLKKPIPVIIFSVLALGTFLIQNWDYSDRGVVPGNNYDWGIAYYLFFAAFVLILGGAVWMLVCKIKAKKEALPPQV